MQNPTPPRPSGCLSWPAVIVALVVFWPVGLILLGARLSQDRAKQMALGGVLMWLGLFIFAPLFLAGCLVLVAPGGFREADALAIAAMLFVFAAGGLALAMKGRSLRRKRRFVQNYVGLIVNQGQSRVDEIAIASGRSDFTKVMAEIQQLITEGFLPGYRLEVAGRLVVRIAERDSAPEEVGFTCQSCGANNMLLALGTYVRCEYCGTPVKV